jgi:O-antigen ligase
MAKSGGKSNPIILGLLWAIFLLLPILKLEALQDKSLLSRHLLLGFGAVVYLIFDAKILKTKMPLWPSVLLLVLGLFTLISNSWAYNGSEAYGVAARFFAFIPWFFLLYRMLEAQFIDAKALLKGLVIFAAGAAVPTLLELFKALGSGAFFDDIYVIKAFFSHKNLLASALMLSFPFVLAAWVVLEKTWSRVAMFLAFIMLIEMFVLRTRGVWLGLFIAAFVSLGIIQIKKQSVLQVPRKWLLIFFGLSLSILMALFFSPQIKAGFTNSSNVQKRLVYWENSMEMIQEHPALGVGAGNWKLLFPKYGLGQVDENTMQGITHIQRPHNDFIWLWAELGPLGLILYLGLFLWAFVTLVASLGNAASKEESVISLAALFALVSLGVFSFSDFPLERAVHMFLFMLILAWAAYSSKKAPALNYVPYLIPVLLVIGLFVNFQRYSSAIKMNDVLVANQQRNAAGLIKATDAAFDEKWYTVDNYANPLPYYRGKGLMVQQNLDLAYQDISLAKEYAPYNILVLDALVQYYAIAGDADQALAWADSALQVSPQFKNVILLKADLHLQRKEFADALGVLNMFEPSSNNQRYLNSLAVALRGALRTYPEHGRFKPMMEHLQNSGSLQQPMDYINAYRRKRGVN